ncbi:MAG: hypothetical protein JSV61_16875 [Anaerolineales bacterium]|nr:MAG: hypothetical protein JSV61_16875 [Anaerolineales bacterium]
MTTIFVQLSGFINIFSGLLMLAFWYLYAILLPYRQLSNTLSILVLDRHWTLVNVLGVSGSMLGILGLTGSFFVQLAKFGRLGLIGFLCAFLGATLLLGALLWDTIIWPILAQHDSTLLDFQGPIYSSKTFVPFFVSAGLVYSLGFILFGIATAQAGVLPGWGGIMLAIGAPLFGLGALFGSYQVIPRTIGVTVFSIGLIWIGYSILKITDM